MQHLLLPLFAEGRADVQPLCSFAALTPSGYSTMAALPCQRQARAVTATTVAVVAKGTTRRSAETTQRATQFTQRHLHTRAALVAAERILKQHKGSACMRNSRFERIQISVQAQRDCMHFCATVKKWCTISQTFLLDSIIFLRDSFT